MPLTRRAGVTLVELLLALVLFGLCGGLMAGSVLRAERAVRTHEERVQLQAAFDAGLAFLAAALADLGPGDLQVADSDSLQFRHTRAVGRACRIAADEVLVLATDFAPGATPQPGRDSLQLPLVIDRASATESSWVSLPILSVGLGQCGGRPALRLETRVDTLAVRIATLPAIVPVRIFEIMVTRLYASLGATWLGARSVSAGEGIQPLAGPFVATQSRFSPRDATGASTRSSGAVRRLEIVLLGLRGDWGSARGAVAESAGILLVPPNLAP